MGVEDIVLIERNIAENALLCFSHEQLTSIAGEIFHFKMDNYFK